VNPDLSQYSDQELVARARAGHEAAYRELLIRYKAVVYRLIVKHIGDADEAMDLTQETFVAGFSALARYDGERPFRIWIARIALNKCRDWGRRRKVRAFFSRALPLESAHHVASDTPAPDMEASDRLELARVRAAIGQLPANLREVLLLRGMDEVSQSEAAAMLDVSEKTIETRLYRARIRLKALLAGTSERDQG
jgi:RNA polymerase sigma-70 factor (ECF subfamily)